MTALLDTGKPVFTAILREGARGLTVEVPELAAEARPVSSYTDRFEQARAVICQQLEVDEFSFDVVLIEEF